jgi:hypothetical protein
MLQHDHQRPLSTAQRGAGRRIRSPDTSPPAADPDVKRIPMQPVSQARSNQAKGYLKTRAERSELARRRMQPCCAAILWQPPGLYEQAATPAAQ